MLEMVKAATRNVNSVAGLFMDELACIFQCNSDDPEELDPDLVNWISEKMAADFEKDFIIDATKEDMDGRVINDAFLPLQIGYAIDDPDMDDHIALTLSQIVFKGTTLATRLIPHFRLLSKCIVKQQKGDLQDINAVLGAPIWMPQKEIFGKLDSLSHQEVNSLCEILFYCYNWFRELINTFAGAGDHEDKNRVLIRLKNMLKIRNDLNKCLALNPNFVPPQMLHLEDVSGWTPPNAVKEDTNGKGKGKGKKSAKRKAGQDITNMPTATSQNTTTTSDNNEDQKEVDLDAYAPFFREFDLDVFNILSFKVLTIGSEPVEGVEFKDPKLRPPEFLLLLKDLNMKLSHILLASKTKKGFPGKAKAKDVGFSNLDQIGSLNVIQRVIPIMDKVLAGLEEIAEYFLRLIEVNDGVMDAIGLYTDDLAPVLTACLEHAFGALKAILCWNGFQDQDQLALMKKALALFGNRLGKINENESLKKLTESAIKYLNRFHKIMINSGGAAIHLKLLEALDAIYPESGTETLHKTSSSYLNRVWVMMDGRTPEKGPKFHAHLEYILNIHLKTAKEPLPIIEDYVENGLLELVQEGQLESNYPTLNKSTLAVHYKVLINFLVAEVKKTTYGATKNHEAQLAVWDACTKILKLLLDVIKPLKHPRALIGPLLKGSRPFLEHFLKHCMPLMDKLFSQKRDDCTALLKTMQASTRFLQHVCSHSKINKDVALSNHVPLLKKALETFVFRVKAMLALNNAVAAFWLGNLKNRDLKGQEISSQIMMEDNDEDQDDPLASEEDKSDVELDGNEEEAPENNEALEESMSVEY